VGWNVIQHSHTLPSLEIDVSSENVVQTDFSIANRFSFVFAIFLFFAIFANAINVATLTSSTSTATTASVTSEVSAATTSVTGSADFVAFSGQGNRLGGDRSLAEVRLLQIAAHRAAQQVIQRSDTVATSLAHSVFQETAGVCTRTSSCAAATLQHFPSIGASGTTSQAVQEVVQNIAISHTSSVIGRVLSNAGPIIATGIASYEIAGNLRDGDYSGAATTATRSFASYHAAAAAGAACATWAAPSAVLSPVLPILAAAGCAISTGVATSRAVDATVSLVSSRVLASSVSNDGASVLPVPVELPAPVPVELPAPVPVELPDPVPVELPAPVPVEQLALVVEPVNHEVDAMWQPTAAQLSNPSYLEALRRAEIYLEEYNMGEIVRTSRRLINFIINDNLRDGNSLQPSEHSHMLLRHFVNSGQIINPRSLSNSEWMNLMGDGNGLFRNVLGSTREDQFLRARSIAQTLIETGNRTVSLMDGHGRIIYLILWHLRNQGVNIDDYRFQIFDLDNDVNAWHARFLPTSVTVLPQDIFANRAELQGVVYFNFCGIGDFVSQTRRTITDLVGQGRSVYLSFSRRGINHEGDTPLACFYRRIIRSLSHPVGEMRGKFVSSHGTFPTYKFFKSK
jgi:hypothetical protein